MGQDSGGSQPRNWRNGAAVVDALLSRNLKVYTYVNNHFAGHSPETMRQFLEMLRERQKRVADNHADKRGYCAFH